jgi:hypothetical protein
MDKVLYWRNSLSTIQLCKELRNILNINVGYRDNEVWIYLIPKREQGIGDAEAQIRKSFAAFFNAKIPSNVKIVTCAYLL